MSNDFYSKKIAPFKYLWKVEDKEWLKQRKNDWEILLSNGFSKYSRAEQSINKKYFMHGKCVEYIPATDQLFMTPCQSADEFNLFINHFFSDAYSKRNILCSYIFVVAQMGESIPWLSLSVKNYVRGFLGDTYQELIQFEGTRNKVYSPDPSYWCSIFITHANMVLSGKRKYSGIVEAIDYFVTALPYSTDTSFRNRKKFNKLFSLISKVLLDKNTSTNALLLAKTLEDKEGLIKSNWAINQHLDQDREETKMG